MAEYLAIDYAQVRGLSVEVRSAGVAALEGVPANPAGVAAMAEWSIDMSAHRGRQLDGGLIAWADRIVAMEPMHRAVVEGMAPEAGAKVVELMKEGVPDPLGGGVAEYRVVRDLLAELLEAFFRREGFSTPQAER
jgi:protein-tyrosine-phosphatase